MISDLEFVSGFDIRISDLKQSMSHLVLAIVLGLSVALPAVAVTIRSETSATAESGGNTGSGNIVTGDATATSVSTITSSGDGTDVEAKATAEAGGEKSQVSVEAHGGDISVEKSESTENTEASIKVDTDSEEAGEPAEPDGMFEKIVVKIFSFVRNLFR